MSDQLPSIEQLLNQLSRIDCQQLDVQQQLIQLRQGKDFNFFIIPITVLLLVAGMAIGLNFDHLFIGFIGGALIALLVGYAYHLWDSQWQVVANQQVIDYINGIEGADGFIIWFKPILAKKNYRRLFYKLRQHQEVVITDYARAIQRLQQKKPAWLAEQLAYHHPQLVEGTEYEALS